eukprot:PITA_02151
MVEEYNSIMVNNVWVLVPRPQDRSVVGSRWIYKIKYAADRSVEKYKVRFVAKGYAQNEGIDYEETFALVARIIRAHWGLQEESSHIIRHEGFGTNALFPRVGSLAIEERDLPWAREYATEILKRFRMEDCRPMATPMITNWKKIDVLEDKDVDPTLYMQLIGSLMYLVNTRPNICYAVNTLNQFMVEPKRVHWATAKHVVKYLQGTTYYGLLYTKGKDIRLSGFTDADWAGSSVDRKSTFGYCFNIGSGMTS